MSWKHSLLFMVPYNCQSTAGRHGKILSRVSFDAYPPSLFSSGTLDTVQQYLLQEGNCEEV